MRFWENVRKTIGVCGSAATMYELSNQTRVIIQQLLPSEVPDASDLLSRSFLTDPMFVGVFGEVPKKARKRIAAVFKLMLEVLPGENVCIKNGERIIAVMRMARPGRCQPSINQIPQALPRLLVATRASFLHVVRYFLFLKKFDPQERHWHLGPLDPELQGRGLGSLLLNYFCAHVDRLSEAAYLETNKPVNVRLYERYGFSTICKAALFGVPNWFMWRPARKAVEKQENMSY